MEKEKIYLPEHDQILWSYLTDGLSKEEAAMFLTHVSECEHCQEMINCKNIISSLANNRTIFIENLSSTSLKSFVKLCAISYLSSENNNLVELLKNDFDAAYSVVQESNIESSEQISMFGFNGTLAESGNSDKSTMLTIISLIKNILLRFTNKLDAFNYFNLQQMSNDELKLINSILEFLFHEDSKL